MGTLVPTIGPDASGAPQADLFITLRTKVEKGIHKPFLNIRPRLEKGFDLPLRCGFQTIRAKTTAIGDLMRRPVYDPRYFPGSAEDRIDPLRDVATLGWDLLSGMLLLEDLEKLLQALEAVQEASFVEVRHGNAMIPWNFLYIQDPKTTHADPMNFLGARWLFVEALDNGEEVLSPGDSFGFNPFVDKDALPGYAFVDDDQLQAVILGIERSIFANYCPTTFRPLVQTGSAPGSAGPLDPARMTTEMSRYGAYLAENWVSMHFAAHGVCPDGDPSGYRMRVSSAFEHTLQELVEAIEVHGGFSAVPFAFFNSCESGVTPAVGEPSACARLLQARGLQSVVAVLTLVWDRFAAHFAEEFYRCALKTGVSIGEALRRARSSVLATTWNPTALTYTLYGRPYTTIASA